MTRIVLRIDRLRLHGIDASDGQAVARALQATLESALRERVDAMPSAAAVVAALQAGTSQWGGVQPAAEQAAVTASQASTAGTPGAARAGGTIQVTAGNSPAALGRSAAHGIVRGWLP
jgi:hypothetical protein